MALIIIGESIWYSEWVTDQFIEYEAICRVSPTTGHGTLNLNWYDEGIESVENNVKNIEDSTLGSTEGYWRRRYSNASLDRIGNSYLDTVRVEKGEMIIYRKWDSVQFWAIAYHAVVVSTLGAPANPHPVINARYINDAGTSILLPALDCFEQFDGEDDAQGNDLWSNIPEGIGIQSI